MKATFVFQVAGQLVTFPNLHFDDGLLLGDPDHPRFKKVKEQVNSHYPRMWWKTTKDGICIHRDDYIGKLQPTGMGKKDDPERSLGTEVPCTGAPLHRRGQ